MSVLRIGRPGGGMPASVVVALVIVSLGLVATFAANFMQGRLAFEHVAIGGLIIAGFVRGVTERPC